MPSKSLLLSLPRKNAVPSLSPLSLPSSVAYHSADTQWHAGDALIFKVLLAPVHCPSRTPTALRPRTGQDAEVATYPNYPACQSLQHPDPPCFCLSLLILTAVTVVATLPLLLHALPRR